MTRVKNYPFLQLKGFIYLRAFFQAIYMHKHSHIMDYIHSPFLGLQHPNQKTTGICQPTRVLGDVCAFTR